MWHYLCFIVLVKVKDSTEYTGPESYVAEMIKVSLEFCFFSPRLDQSSGILGTVLCIVFNLFCKCTCDFPALRALCVCAGVGDIDWWQPGTPPGLNQRKRSCSALNSHLGGSIFKLEEVPEAQPTGYNLSWYKYLQLTCRICCHMIGAYYCEKLQLMSTQLEGLLMRELKASSMPSCRFRAPGITSEAQSLICVFWLASKSCLIYRISVWFL